MNKSEDITRKREVIAKKIRLIENGDAEAEALAILDNYLLVHHKNKTPERSFILSLLYKLSLPADIETIHSYVENNYGHVSPTTVYYALQLFIEAGIARRVELIENGPSFYEKTIGTVPHGYTVCSKCGALRYISLEKMSGEIGRLPATGFRIVNVSLVLHGICRSCSKKVTKSAINKKKI